MKPVELLSKGHKRFDSVRGPTAFKRPRDAMSMLALLVATGRNALIFCALLSTGASSCSDRRQQSQVQPDPRPVDAGALAAGILGEWRSDARESEWGRVQDAFKFSDRGEVRYTLKAVDHPELGETTRTWKYRIQGSEVFIEIGDTRPSRLIVRTDDDSLLVTYADDPDAQTYRYRRTR